MMKRNFEELFYELNESKNNILKPMYEELEKEKYKKRNLIYMYVLFPSIFIIILYSIYIVKMIMNEKLPEFNILYFFITIELVLYAIIINKNTNNRKRYSRKIKNNIIFKIVNNFFDNVDYIPNKELPIDIYNEIGYEYYDIYEADDYIEGYIRKRYKIIMANVNAVRNNNYKNGEAKNFNGLFVKINLNKSINSTIKIYNYEYISKENVSLDSSNFEEIFDVNTNNNIKTMQLLTADVMELLVKFSKFINSEFDISIIDNNMYIRIDNDMLLDVRLDGNNIYKRQMKYYYNTFKFIYNLSLYVIKWIEESYISE